MYGGMAQPSLLALGFIWSLVSLIGQWPTGPPNINATPPPCYRAGMSRSGLWGPELLHSLSGIRLPVSSEPTRTSCPGYGYARSSGIVPTVTRARNRRCEGPCIGIVAGVCAFQTSNFLLRTSAQRLIPAARASPSRAGTRSLWLARSDHPRLRFSHELETFFAVHCQPTTSNCQLTSPLSCRWRSDWLPCHPSQSIGGIRDRRFQLLLYRQTSGQECVLQRATFATVADMRRRPSLPIRWMHHCRRLFSEYFLTRLTCENSKQGLTPT